MRIETITMWALGVTALVVSCKNDGDDSRARVAIAQTGEPLRSAFNADVGKVRVMMLVSPTCGGCLRGASSIDEQLFEQTRDTELRGYAIWVPKSGGKREAVPAAIPHVSDERIKHFWDEGGALMERYSAVLELDEEEWSEDAWDVYLLYGPDARWSREQPPEPDFWMHQLRVLVRNPRPEAPFLDANVFAHRARALLPSP